MRKISRNILMLALGGSMLLGVTGTCLPDDFFATLAGDVIADVVKQVVSDVVSATLPAGGG